MDKIYLVKSFGPDAGFTNLKAFSLESNAEAYAELVRKQIPDFSVDEFVEVEKMDLL
jgi:hypothetical protein